jgi:hypothetical protein
MRPIGTTPCLLSDVRDDDDDADEPRADVNGPFRLTERDAFTIRGTAEGVGRVILYIAPSDYRGEVSIEAFGPMVKAGGYPNWASVPADVKNGTWAANFHYNDAELDNGSYKMYVFDYSSCTVSACGETPLLATEKMTVDIDDDETLPDFTAHKQPFANVTYCPHLNGYRVGGHIEGDVTAGSSWDVPYTLEVSDRDTGLTVCSTGGTKTYTSSGQTLVGSTVSTSCPSLEDATEYVLHFRINPDGELKEVTRANSDYVEVFNTADVPRDTIDCYKG